VRLGEVRKLQAALTPARDGLPERRFGGRVFRVGDKAMQLRNNYDKGTVGVFNGSVGQATALSLEDQKLRVLVDEDEEVGYGSDKLDELTHAYAVSIHRSQGSELADRIAILLGVGSSPTAPSPSSSSSSRRPRLSTSKSSRPWRTSSWLSSGPPADYSPL
jgi:ATP-dependent exoDNAse (exonuclease V) alpha subunit